MKKLSGFLLLSLFWIACVNDQKADKTKDTGKTAKEKQAAAPSEEKLLVLPWTAVYNTETEQLELEHNATSHPENLTVEDMIDAINLKYPDTKLYKTGQRNDTLDVTINDAVYLTQQTGTAGAQTYLAEATFALTELPGIKAVAFYFKEGDHATPKTYSRESFKDFN